MSTNHQRVAAQFTEANRRAAAVILEDPEKYGGDRAAIVEWARVVRYEVDFRARSVAYSGCHEEEYIEDYPAVDIP